MRSIHVPLNGVIHLVASYEDDARLREKSRDHPGLPHTVDQLAHELAAMRDGVPATIDEPNRWNSKRTLLVHSPGWVVRLVPTHSERGYLVRSVDPLRVRDHDRLARHYLLLHPGGWTRVQHLRELGEHLDSCWRLLEQRWRQLVEHQAEQAAAPALPPHHEAFLDTVGQVIDANERIAAAAAEDERPYPYREVKPVGEQRQGAHAVYGFALAGGDLPEERAFVRVRGEPERRGQVVRVDGDLATVRFDEPVDWNRLPKVGELEATTSTVVFTVQREAVTRLRDRRSRNPHLLAALVDARTRSVRDARDEPTADLDPDQLRAFRRALAVEDLMLVLGPPGTGKTRVISQVADAAATGDGAGRAPQRVLLTSHSNRAVDNILPNLADRLVVVRVGNPGVVTEEGKPYLLDAHVRDLRGRILAGTADGLAGLAAVEVAEKWAAELRNRLDAFAAALEESGRALGHLDEARRAAGGPAQAEVDALGAALAGVDHRLDRVRRSVERATRRGRTPLLGWWYRRRLGGLQAKADRLHHERQATHDRLDRARRVLEEVTATAPAVRAAVTRLTAAARRAEEARASALTAAHAARAAVGGSEPPPPVADTEDQEATRHDLTALAGWLERRLPVLRARARLLSDWRREVSGATDQLYPELIRYADVIAATTVGTGSRPELSGVDFDLVVVDEAGQVGTADLLVPLVRARRAVLVGDQHQLPPFLGSEVEAWGREVGGPRVREVLAKSALELLVDRLPAANVVPLTRQRRMPAVIAEFASRFFYRNTLETARAHEHRDELFGSPFVFVDTSLLPERRRYERPARERDHRQKGVHNPAEALLLSRLAAHYDALGREWAVIVPYTAQVKRITSSLVRLIGDEPRIGLNVGSVDSFQGGERDVILYGFTRGNADGRVGFLDELRRANVAFTRAKGQLVLVGDLSTLTRATDDGFRALAEALRDYVATAGEIRQYDEVLRRVGGR